MKVQGRLVHARFIEIHKDSQKKSDSFLTDHIIGSLIVAYFGVFNAYFIGFNYIVASIF